MSRKTEPARKAKTGAKANVSKSETVETYIQQFRQELESSNCSVLRMGEIYVAALKLNHRCGPKFTEAFPQVSGNRWERLRLIGHGDVDVDIWYMSDLAAVAALRLREVDRTAMIAAAKEGVDIVSRDGKTIRKVDLKNPSQEKLNILIDKTTRRLRTIEEQREYLEEKRKAKAAGEAANLPYSVEGSFIQVRRTCRLMKTDVRNMLLELFEGDAKTASKFVLAAASET